MNDDLKFKPIEDGASTLDAWFSESGYFETPSNPSDSRMQLYTEQQRQALMNRPTRALYDDMLRRLPKGMTQVAFDKDNNQLVVVVSPDNNFKFQNGQIVRGDNGKPFARGAKPAVLKLDVETAGGALTGKGKNNGFQIVVDSGGSTRLMSNLDAVLLEVGKELTKHAKQDLATISRAFQTATSKFNQSYSGGAESLKDLLNEQIQAGARMPQTQLILNAIKSTSVGAGQYASAIRDKYLHGITGRLGGDAIVAIESALVAREEAQARAILESFVRENMRHRMSKSETEDLVARVLHDRTFASGLTQRHSSDDAFGTGRIGVASAAADALSSGDSPTREQWLRDMLRSAYVGKGKNRQQVLYRGLYSSSPLEKSIGVHRGSQPRKKQYGASFDAVMPILHTFGSSLGGQKLLNDILYLTSGGVDALSSVRATKLEVSATESEMKRAEEAVRRAAAGKEWRAHGKKSGLEKDEFIKAFEEQHTLDEYADLAVRKLLGAARQVRDRGADAFNLNDATAKANWDSVAQRITFVAREIVEAGTGTKVSDKVIKQSLQRADDIIASAMRELGLDPQKYKASGISIVSGIDNERKGMRTLEDMVESMIGEYISDIGINSTLGKNGANRTKGYSDLRARLESIKQDHKGDKTIEAAIDMLLGGKIIDFDNRTYKVNNLVGALSGLKEEDAGKLIGAIAYVSDIAMREKGSEVGRLFTRDAKTGELTLRENGFYRSFSTIHQNNEYPAVHGADLSRAIKAIAADVEYVPAGQQRDSFAKAVREVIMQNGPSQESLDALAAGQSMAQAAIDATNNGGKGIASGTTVVGIKALGGGKIEVNGRVIDVGEYEGPMIDSLSGSITNFNDTFMGQIFGALTDVAEPFIKEAFKKSLDELVQEDLAKNSKQLEGLTDKEIDAYKQNVRNKIVEDYLRSNKNKIMIAYDWRTEEDREAGRQVLVGADAKNGVYVDRGYLPAFMFAPGSSSSDATHTFLSTIDPNDPYAYERARYDLYRDVHNDWFYEQGVEYKRLMETKTEDAKTLKLLGMNPEWYKKYAQYSGLSKGGIKDQDVVDILRGYASVHGAIGHNKTFDDLIKDVSTEDILRALRVIYPNFSTEDRKEAIEKLRSIFTIGSQGSKDLLNAAREKMGKGVSIYDALGMLLTDKDLGILNMLGFRAPFSHGINDANYLSFFMDQGFNSKGGAFGSDADAGAIMISLASQLAMGADWDGDTGVFLGSGNDAHRRKVFNVGTDVQKRLREWRSAFVYGSQKANPSAWQTNKMGQLVNTALFSDASRAQRVSKLKTGVLANLRGNMQAFINNRLNSGGTIDPNFLVAHMFFEGLAQDAISSKKIINSLMNLRVNDRGELERVGNEEILPDQDELTDSQLAAYEEGLDAINTVVGNIFSNNGSIKDIFAALTTAGLIDENGLFSPDKKEIFADTVFTLSRMAMDKSDPAKQAKAQALLDQIGGKGFIVDSKDKALEFAKNGPKGAGLKTIVGALTESALSMGIQGADNPMSLIKALAFHKYQPEKREASIEDVIHGRDTSGVFSEQGVMLDMSEAVTDIAGKLQIIIGLLQHGLVGKMGGTMQDAEDAYKKYGGLESQYHAAHRIAQIVTGATSDFTTRQGDVNRLAIARSVFDGLVGKGIKIDGESVRFDDFSSLYNKPKLNKEESSALSRILNRLKKSTRNDKFIEQYGLNGKTISDIDDDLTVLRGTYVGFLDSQIKDLENFDPDNNRGNKQFKVVQEMYRAALRRAGLTDEEVAERMKNAASMALRQRWLRQTYVGDTAMAEVPLAGGLRGGISTADFLTFNKDTHAVGVYESKTGKTANILDSEKIQAQVYAALVNKLFTDIQNKFGEIGFLDKKGRSIKFSDRSKMDSDDFSKLRNAVIGDWSKNKLFLEYFGGDQEEMGKLFDLLFKHDDRNKIIANLGRVAENGDTSVWSGLPLTPELMQKLLENPASITDSERADLLAGHTVVHKPSQDVFKSLLRGIGKYKNIQRTIEMYRKRGLRADHDVFSELNKALQDIKYYDASGQHVSLLNEDGTLPDVSGIFGMSPEQIDIARRYMTSIKADAEVRQIEENERKQNVAFKEMLGKVRSAINIKKLMEGLKAGSKELADAEGKLSDLGILDKNGKLLFEGNSAILSEDQRKELQRILTMGDLAAAERAQSRADIESQRSFREAIQNVKSMADLKKKMEDLKDEKGAFKTEEDKKLYGAYQAQYDLLDADVTAAIGSGLMTEEQRDDLGALLNITNLEEQSREADAALARTEQSKAEAEAEYIKQLNDERSLLKEIYDLKSQIAQLNMLNPEEGSNAEQLLQALQKRLNEDEDKLRGFRADTSRARIQEELTEDQIRALGGKDSSRVAAIRDKQNQILTEQLLRDARGLVPPGRRKDEEKQPGMFTGKWWLNDFVNGPKTAFAMLFRGGVTTRIVLSFIQNMKKTIQLTEQLNASMTNLRIITGKNAKEAKDMMMSYNDLAKTLGVTTAAISQIGAEWLRQGYSAQEAEGLIESSVKLAKLGFMDQGAAVKSLTAAMKGFNIEASDSMSIVDKLTTLDAKYATTAGDIATALTRVASVANNAGLSLEETAAAITAVIDTTQQDAGTVGNAFRTMLSRYGNVKFGAFESLEEDEGEDGSINDVERVLNAIGIQIRTSKLEMRDFADVLDDIAEKWTALTTVEQNAVAVALGGVRQRNTTVALLNSYGTYKKALEDQELSEGSADRKYEAYTQSVEYTKQQLQATWEELVLKIEQSGLLKGIYTILGTLVDTAQYWFPTLMTLLPGIYREVSAHLQSNKAATQENTVATQGNTAALHGKPATGTGTTPPAEGNVTPPAEGGKSTGKQGYWWNRKSMTGKQIAGMSVVNGITTGLSYGVSGGGALGNAIDNGLKTTPHETSKDNITTGILSGLTSAAGSAIGGAFGGPLGMMVGNVAGSLLGDGIASLIKYEEHKSEIMMRKRVEENKKILEGIQKVSGSIVSLGDSIRDGMETWSAKDYEDNLELFNNIKVQYLESDSLRERIDKLLGIEEGSNELLNKNLSYFAEKDKNGVSNASKLEAATIIEEAIATYKANEEDIDYESKELIKDQITVSALRKMQQDDNEAYKKDLKAYAENKNSAADYENNNDGGYYTYDEIKSLYNLFKKEDIIKDKWKFLSADERKIKWQAEGNVLSAFIDQQIDELLNASTLQTTKINTYVENRNKEYLKASFLTSGLADMQTYQLNNMTLDQAVRLIANEWKKNGGTGIYDVNGNLSYSKRQDIIDYIRSNDQYKPLIYNDVLTYGDISYNRKRANDIIEAKYPGESIDSILKDLNSENTVGDYTDEEINTFYKANEDGLINIAHGLNMTAEEAEKAGDSISWVTSSDVASGIEGMVDKFEKLSGILSEIASSGSISASNMNNIIKNYSWLFGSGEDISADSVIQNFVDILNGDKSIDAIAGIIASSARTDADLWSLFKKKYGEDWSKIGIGDKESKSKMRGSTTWESVRDIMLNNGSAQSAWAQFVAEFTGNLDIAKTLRGLLVNAASNVYENEISNLQSIKDSLEDVNKLRQKELDLMKAKLALENAQKEKQRVYREGVGWVYTSDQNAIKEAADKVEELEREKDQNDIQYQIDMLEQTKSILENLEKNEELEQLNEILGAFLDPNSEDGFGKKIGSIVTAISKINPNNFSGNIKDRVGTSIKDDTNDVIDEEAEAIQNKINDLFYNEDGTYKSMNNWADENFLNGKKISEIINNHNDPYYYNAIQEWNNQIEDRTSAVKDAQGYDVNIPIDDFNKDRDIKTESGVKSVYMKQTKGDTWDETFYVVPGGHSSLRELPEYDQIIDKNSGDNTYKKNTVVYSGGTLYGFVVEDDNGNEIASDSELAYVHIGNEKYYNLENLPGDSFVFNDTGIAYGAYKDVNGNWHTVVDAEGKKDLLSKKHNFSTDNSIEITDPYSYNAYGTFSFAGGRTLINERGLEGIITPEGTLTSLPAKSGILPADLTKNLWALGEVAPNLITELNGKSFSRVSEEKIEDNSMTVGTLNATFNTDSGFDAKTFWSDVKSQIALTKNNH